MAAVQSLLDNVDVVIKGRSFEEIVRSSYSCQVECSAQATQGALELVKELMSNGGEHYTLWDYDDASGRLFALHLLPAHATTAFLFPVPQHCMQESPLPV